MAKRITLEQLATMVANGFEDTKQDFQNLQQTFHQEVNRLDVRLDQMTPRFEMTEFKKAS